MKGNYSNAISSRLAQKPRKPKAKRVHHTEKELRKNLSIPANEPLTKPLRHAQDTMEAYRKFGNRKTTRKLFNKASTLQHKAMDEYATDYEKKGKEAREQAIEERGRTIGDKQYNAGREEKIQSGTKAQMEANEINDYKEFKEWQKKHKK